MINILRNAYETYQYRDWDKSVMVQVRAILAMIDKCYNKGKEIQKIVLLCDRDTTVDEVISIINIPYGMYELVDEVWTCDETYTMALYLLYDDSAIIIVTTSLLFDELQSIV